MAGMRSRHRMRCNAGRRKGAATPHWLFTIPKHPDLFKRDVKCPTCGSTDVVSCEETYRRAQAKRAKCYCFTVPHPHVKGKHRLCLEHPLVGVPLTEDEERQAMDVANDTGRTSNV